MTNDAFHQMVEEATKARLDMAMQKGREYANEQEDRNFNFKIIATLLGIEPETVAMVYKLKHILSMCTYIKDLEQGKPRELVEPIEGRIDDDQNYSDLLRGIIRDRDTGKLRIAALASCEIAQEIERRLFEKND